MSASTVTISRVELEEIVVSLGALAGFADRIYGGGSMESVLWNETLSIQKSLLEAAGLSERDDEVRVNALERRFRREDTREKALVEKYVAGLAVAS